MALGRQDTSLWNNCFADLPLYRNPTLLIGSKSDTSFISNTVSVARFVMVLTRQRP